MSEKYEGKIEITNFPCPVCGTHLEIHNDKVFYCPHCGHVEPVEEDGELDFSAVVKKD